MNTPDNPPFDDSMDTDDFDPFADAEARREDAEDRIRHARFHWCDVCHGHTGPGSPCYDERGQEDET